MENTHGRNVLVNRYSNAGVGRALQNLIKEKKQKLKKKGMK